MYKVSFPLLSPSHQLPISSRLAEFQRDGSLFVRKVAILSRRICIIGSMAPATQSGESGEGEKCGVRTMNISGRLLEH